MHYRKLWIALAVVVIGSFIVLGLVGKQMIDNETSITEGC